MYHCPVTFYLVGLPDEIARIIEDAQPQPSFTHHFTRSDEPEEALTAQASAIFADATATMPPLGPAPSPLTAKPPQPSPSSSPTIR